MEPKDEIKLKTDVAELVGEYLDLKPAGSGSFKTTCPFHQEKTPSFYVSSEKQIWHCFGCGEGGDVYSFLMKMEGMDFSEALRHLGKRCGVEVKRFESSKSQENQRLSEINELASKFFEKVLMDSPRAEAARRYLDERGIDGELREKFGIGFALDAWEALAQFLSKRKYADHEGLKAGLLLRSKKGSGMIDRFRNRIMIPLRDHHGHVVGFTGRILPGTDDRGPKYMNSPETPVYRKSELLYGLDLAKRAIKEAGQIVVVEGNLDVVSSHKAGVENVVASSGTALTVSQLDLLKRFTNTIAFAFDADAAGFAAARRGMRLAKEQEFDVRVIVLPDEVKDPDELVQKDAAKWKAIQTQTIPVMEFLIKKVSEGKDFKNVDDKKEVAAELLPELVVMQDVVEREHWLQVIADLVRTDVKYLRDKVLEMASEAKGEEKTEKKQEKPQNVKKTKEKYPKEERAVRLLIGLCVQDPGLCDVIFAKLSEEMILNVDLKTLYKIVQTTYHQTQEPVQKSFFLRVREQLEQDQEKLALRPLLDSITLLAEQFVSPLAPPKVQEQLQTLVDMLRSSFVKRRKKDLEAEIRQAEQSGDAQRVTQLIQEYRNL